MQSHLLVPSAFLLILLLNGCASLPSIPATSAARDKALLGAAFNLDVPRVEQLLSAGANVNTRSSGSFCGNCPADVTSLHYATESPVLVRLLLNRGADVNAADSHGYTPICYALSKHHIASATLLVAAGAKLPPPKDGEREFLHYAVIEARHNVEQEAIVEGIRILIELGAEVNMQSEVFDGDTPLHLAISGIEDPMTLAMPQSKQWSRDAALRNRTLITIARMLIEAGAKVNTQSHDGSTALHRAASSARVDAVKILLAAGADPLITDKKGNTPLASTASWTAIEDDKNMYSYERQFLMSFKVVAELLKKAEAQQRAAKNTLNDTSQ